MQKWLEGLHHQQQLFQQLPLQQWQFEDRLEKEQQCFMLQLLDQGKPNAQVGATALAPADGVESLKK